MTERLEVQERTSRFMEAVRVHCARLSLTPMQGIEETERVRPAGVRRPDLVIPPMVAAPIIPPELADCLRDLERRTEETP